jgi:succinyl-diaminopimelate desuccinylase
VIVEFGADSGPVLVLCGHIDTVPAGESWSFDPLGARVEDGRVYGGGASDMLGGVDSMCAAALAVKRSGVAAQRDAGDARAGARHRGRG